MRRLLPLILLAGLLGWVGCDTMSTPPAASSDASAEESPPATSDAGHIQVHLKDAPGDIAEAYVTIRRVELVPSGNDSIIVLSDSTRKLDLLTLQNGVTETLADTTLPAGTYSQDRLIVGTDATIRLEDGSEPRLKIPSGTQTGIKIVVPASTVVERDSVDVPVPPGEVAATMQVLPELMSNGASPQTTVELLAHVVDVGYGPSSVRQLPTAVQAARQQNQRPMAVLMRNAARAIAQGTPAADVLGRLFDGGVPGGPPGEVGGRRPTCRARASRRTCPPATGRPAKEATRRGKAEIVGDESGRRSRPICQHRDP